MSLIALPLAVSMMVTTAATTSGVSAAGVQVVGDQQQLAVRCHRGSHGFARNRDSLDFLALRQINRPRHSC